MPKTLKSDKPGQSHKAEKTTEAGKFAEFTFETAFHKLDEILAAMECEDIPLEKSFELYEAGIGLIAGCNKSLCDIEAKVKILNE